ncbi:class I SAM-dependent methyltransferase [Prolixibacteraceae bacterium Z1-6]|uniref:Class I SAM-dependent methyltransferase n=1 Tax=Draconibacterium aestuarii TaxID=2998507 RepID=A0A9X3F4E6_9BACT|nr:class I SAM-dependent methyltransferase [Prolixibacteraceae bacterium Z1-6]
MITDDLAFWNKKAKQENWMEYILPGKTAKEFHDSGYLQAELVIPFGDKQKTVLDYGCGIGRVLKHVAPAFKHAYGLDVCSVFLDRAISYCVGCDNITFATTEKFTDKSEIADVIYCLMVMQHNSSENIDLIIKHIHSLLKADGIAIIQFPRVESKIYKETKFVHKFSLDEIMHIARNFSSVAVYPANLATYQNPDVDYNMLNEYILIAHL